MRYVRYAVEGPSDEPVAEKLINSVGLMPYRTLTAYGKGNLDKKLPGLNNTANEIAWLVIRDVDKDDRDLCIPDLHSKLLGGDVRGGMCFAWPSDPPRLGYWPTTMPLLITSA